MSLFLGRVLNITSLRVLKTIMVKHPPVSIYLVMFIDTGGALEAQKYGQIIVSGFHLLGRFSPKVNQVGWLVFSKEMGALSIFMHKQFATSPRK